MKYIIGNWKLNGSRALVQDFFNKLDVLFSSGNIVLCLPYTLLGADLPGVQIGAQDVSVHTGGAFTGEVSAEMVREAGAKYSIVGHSERRKNFGETNEIVHEKALRCIEVGIIPIICVEDAGQVIASCPESGEFIIAYEPVSAIGTGTIPSAGEIETVHTEIHALVSGRPVLYGGSVKPENTKEILNIPGVDGVLVGGASLKPDQFIGIINEI